MNSRGALSMKSYSFLSITSAVVIVIAAQSSLFAGEVLRLKAGTIRLQDASNQLFQAGLQDEKLPATRQHRELFVVQFNSKITRADRATLKTYHATIRRYLPDDAYLVSATKKNIALAKLGMISVKAVAPFNFSWKIASSLTGVLASNQKEQLTISLAERELAHTVARELEALPNLKILSVTNGDFNIEAPASLVTTIAQMSSVEWIEKSPIIVSYSMPLLNDDAPTPTMSPSPAPYTFTGFESGAKVMNFDAAYARGFHGEGQTVAVADTGIDSGNLTTLHQDLRTNVIGGYPIGLGADSWADPMGHGTHVAGSIVGDGTLSEGKIKGGAYGAHLISLGLWSPLINNLAPGSDFNVIIGTGYDHGARIHSNSWGAPGNPGAYDSMASHVDEYIFNHQEMLVLFAAGNSGEDANGDGVIDENSIGSPGTAKNVLTVGASKNYLLVGGIQKTLGKLRNGDKKWGVPPLRDDTLSNNPNGLACFSSRGPTSDGRIKPEIVAPGTNIISTRDHQTGAELLWGAFDDNYLYSGGTSMSTPLTAGAAAVGRQFLVQQRQIVNPSGALVKALLLHTAFDMYPGQYGTGPTQELPTKRPNVHEGYGRVNMDLATSLGAETTIVDNISGVAGSDKATFNFTVESGKALRATMTYMDAPASAAAEKTLVNDLDLSITSPSGKVYTLNDHTNNTEMLEIAAGETGTFQITVTGTNVPQGLNGKQPYALIVGEY